MKTEWDYTTLADAYLKRPDYADSAIDQLIKLTEIIEGDPVCDVGAGAAHLTLQLAQRGLDVVAVEPNDAMRSHGIAKTSNFTKVKWFDGKGEKIGQPDSSFKLVTFGSSFNVTKRELALKETARILRAGGWFACLWNHRRLDDPFQEKIENIIKNYLPNYNYGTRREDQSEVIHQSGLFGKVHKITVQVSHEQTIANCIEAWSSHSTLKRQAGEKFVSIIKDIETFLNELNQSKIQIPYSTNIWISQLTAK